MKVLLVDQIAKVNYKYTFPLANGLEKAGAKVLLAIDQKQEKENCRCERINLFNTDEKNVGKLEKMQNYIASYKKIGELLRTEKFDVLHTEWYTFSPIDYLFLNRYKKSMVWSMWRPYTTYYPSTRNSMTSTFIKSCMDLRILLSYRHPGM